MAKLRRAVRASFGLADLKSGDALLLGVSGGADSMALASAAAFEGKRAGIRVFALVVDHALQTDSAEFTQLALDRLAKLNLAGVESMRVSVGRAGGTENAAREARFDAFLAAAKRIGANHLMLGHTQNDQAETVLLGLVRGSGGRSIAGIWPVTEYDGLTVLHPLLNVSRADTETYCRDAQLEFWNDPHNADESFTRVRVRKNVMPMLEDQLGAGVVSALARTAELLQADVDFLDALAADAFASCVIPSATSVTVSLPALEQLANPISSRVILRALRLFSSAAAAVHVNSVLELSTDWHGQKPLTLPGVRVERTGENLVFKSTKTLKSGAC